MCAWALKCQWINFSVSVSEALTKTLAGGGSNTKDNTMNAAILVAYLAIAGLLKLAYADYSRPTQTSYSEKAAK